MASRKGPVYKEEDVLCNISLLNDLKYAVECLEEKMKAVAPIMKSDRRIGWGVSKTHRSIAADHVISIAKAIKSLKGW